MAFWISPAELRRRGIVGMNMRNGSYIGEHNPRHRYPLVDNKLITKSLAQNAGVAVPELYGVVRTHHGLRELGSLLEGHDSFVVKPVQGSGGNGIVVLDGRFENGSYRRANGRRMTPAELEHHVGNILAGAYSLGGQPDVAMIEQRVEFSDAFRDISYQGVPDIRIIVYRGCPAMAMVRLPTRQSDGKANLHQGAIGAGVDLETGITTEGVWQNRRLRHHPDTACSVAGHVIPHWEDQLRLAARCHDLTGLGYLGVDLILDRRHGPLLLELNARPGLAIQIANEAGLRWRLRAIDRWLESHGDEPPGAEARAHWFARAGLEALAQAAARDDA